MKKLWGIFWTVAAFLGGYALWNVLRLPSEMKNSFFFGLSGSRLALCAVMALLILFCLYGIISAFFLKENAFSSGKIAGIASFFIIFGLIIGKIFLTPPVGRTALERSLLERLLPPACWGFVFSVFAFIILLIQKFSRIRKYQTKSVPALVWGMIVFAMMAVSILFSLKTGTGLDPISGTFYRQGVSLLEGHLIVPLLFLYPLFPLFLIFGPKISNKKTGTALLAFSAIIVWLAAVWFWQTTAFEGRSYFAPALRAPNYNYYPASDAENYDLLAQSVLLGNGFRNGMTVVRPLYAAFLALLHLIFGNDYMQLTNGQILLLALIPAVIFLTGKQLQHTAAGFLAASWIIWREIYSIRVTPLVQVSNSRLLMSDLPTLLLVAMVVLCAVKWYGNGDENVRSLLCGGMIGTSMLLRTQCFVLIPALWLIFLCSSKKPSKKWLSVLFSILGLLIVFAPWTVWGKLHPNTTADADVSEGQYLNNLYRDAVGETDPDAGLFRMITRHPGKSLSAVAAHFLNNEISSLLILPLRLIKPQEADQLFYEEDLFWYRENARQTIEENELLLIVYLLILSFGITTSVRKNGFGGMIPFLIHIVYNLGNAFAMTSGFRFILPSDWVMLFYFAMGCTAVLDFVNRVLLFNISEPRGKREAGSCKTSSDQGWIFAGALVMLAMIGAVLPLCEKIIPLRFEAKTSDQIRDEYGKIFSLDLSGHENDEMVFMEGRAFYPRFYKAGEGDSGGSSSAKRGMDVDRLVWMFHDQRVHVLCDPMTEEQVLSMTAIPDPMDVIVAGIPREDYIEVLDMKPLEIEK